MASIGFLIGRALVNALAFTGSNYLKILNLDLKIQSIKKERDMIRPSKIYKELK